MSPYVSSSQWDAILRKTRFSGVDTVTPDHDRFPYPGSVILSQAIEPQINLLRRPLSAHWPQGLKRHPLGRLLIVGGATLKTTVLVEELPEILIQSYSETDRIGSIADITRQHLMSVTKILCLAQLDELVSKGLTPKCFQGLKSVFSQGITILWVTQGRRADAPESNMIYGFVRSQLWEVSDLRIQFIDLESVSIHSTHLIAETIVRFSHLVAWERASQLASILWSVEPELVVRDGRLYLPRLYHWKAANDRLNSSKRPILQRVSVRDSNIRINDQHGNHVLAQLVIPTAISSATPDCVNFKVDYSLSIRTRTTLGDFFIVVGVAEGDHSLKLALSNT